VSAVDQLLADIAARGQRQVAKPGSQAPGTDLDALMIRLQNSPYGSTGVASGLAQDQIVAAQAARAVEEEHALKGAGTIPSLTPSMLQHAFGQDPRFAQTGVEDFNLRAGLSAMETDPEKAAFLTNEAGQGGWQVDHYGKYNLLPSGLEKRGLPPAPPGFAGVSLDEPEITWGDVADLRGSAPEIVAATVAGAVAGAGGGPPGVIAGGLGRGVAAAVAAGTTAKALDELGDLLTGRNTQSLAEVGVDIGLSTIDTLVGELGGAGVAALLRKSVGPNAGFMNRERMDVLEGAERLGARPNLGRLTKSPLFGRFEGMMDNILGNPRDVQNSKAILDEMDRIRVAGRGDTPAQENLAVSMLDETRAAKRDWYDNDMTPRYEHIDATVGGGNPIIDTTPLRDLAAKLRKQVEVRNTEGTAIGAPESVLKQLEDIEKAPDFVSLAWLRSLRTSWREASDITDVVGTLGQGRTKALLRGIEDTLTAAPNSPGGRAYGSQRLTQELDNLRALDADYAEGIKRYKGSLIKRLGQHADAAKNMTGDEIVKLIFGVEGKEHQIADLVANLSPQTLNQVRGAATERMFSRLENHADDPLESTFTPSSFHKMREEVGDEALDALFGSGAARDLKVLDDTVRVTKTRQSLSGGIVAANVALHPIVNFPLLLKIRFMSELIRVPGFRKYLTVGLFNPHTPAGKAGLKSLNILARGFSQTMTRAQENMTPQAEFSPNER
jgi:hypothetical protein